MEQTMQINSRLRATFAASAIAVLSLTSAAFASDRPIFGGIGSDDLVLPQQQQQSPGNTGPYDSPDFVVPESQIFSWTPSHCLREDEALLVIHLPWEGFASESINHARFAPTKAWPSYRTYWRHSDRNRP
jgi:hypothetical protein